MHDLDSPDFNKARGFLLGYSSIVMALWVFGVNLQKLQLMGAEIQATTNVNHAWLAICLVNLYFLARFYQRLPKSALRFDETMQELYDEALVWASLRIYGPSMMKALRAHTDSDDNIVEAANVQLRAIPTCHEKIDDANQRNPNAWDIRYLSRSLRTEMRIHIEYSLIEEQGENPYRRAFPPRTVAPSALITLPVKLFTILQGAVVTPWLTDHVAPLLWGGASTLVALGVWLRVNHLLGL
jgi:hypothetical protein